MNIFVLNEDSLGGEINPEIADLNFSPPLGGLY